jgi:hypothetical protein
MCAFDVRLLTRTYFIIMQITANMRCALVLLPTLLHMEVRRSRRLWMMMTKRLRVTFVFLVDVVKSLMPFVMIDFNSE